MLAIRIKELIMQCPTINSLEQDKKKALYYSVRRKRCALHVLGKHLGSSKK